MSEHQLPRVVSLFSGYGGLDMGLLSVLGGTVVAHSEIDQFACRVLEHHWPGIPNYGDVTTAVWDDLFGTVDLVVGGFPCQSVSLNGRRGGLICETGDDLFGAILSPWEGMVRAITELEPRAVVIENVGGLLSAPVSAVGPGSETVGGAFGRILSDLAGLGFDAFWCRVPASHAGAAHRRRRVFILAVAADTGGEECTRWAGLRPREQAEIGGGRPGDSTLAPSEQWGRFRPAISHWGWVIGRPAPDGLVVGPSGGLIANARFMEWHMGLPDGWVTDVPGISPDQQRKLLGNGVVPQQAAMAIRFLVSSLPPSSDDAVVTSVAATPIRP